MENTQYIDGLTAKKLTTWKNEPTCMTLKQDLEAAKVSHDAQAAKIKHWVDLRNVEGKAKPPKIKGRSSVQPKLIRRQAEWRYSALTEPFLGSPKLFKISPVTYEDTEAAKQNELVLNHQFRTKMNRVKFIDDYVRSTVDEGTCIVRLGWKRSTVKVKELTPVYEHRMPFSPEEIDAVDQALALKGENPRQYEEQVPPEIKAAVDFYEESGTHTVAVQVSTAEIETDKVIDNRPTVEIMNPVNVYIDPSCNGDLDKAMFVIVSFETSKAELKKEPDRYKNLEFVNWDSAAPPVNPDHASGTPDTFQFKDALRKRVVAYEYWGYYDVEGNDKLTPFVATWVGDTMIRMEVNPFPDEKPPFVVVPYMPVKREVYGETDAELLEDNQAVLGAVTRGMIDLMGRSANAQQGFAKGMLDILNRRRFENGQDYEFNPNLSPQLGHIEHKFPEIPQSAITMLTLQNQEAEALTGVKSFGGGISGEAYGDVAAGIRGVLDAASKREMAILRRLAKGMTEIGNKIIAMNGVFLSDKEVIRITNEQFVEVSREDLQGQFDLEVDISTAEVDNAKAQDLGFMLQTIGPNMDLGMTKLILTQIAELKRMPDLAHMIKTYAPQPDPLQQRLQEAEIRKAEMEVAKLQSEIDLNKAKAKQAEAQADTEVLNFVEQETGTKHERDMEKLRGQAQGNQDLEVTKSLLKSKKPDESKPDIEAAIGFNELSGSSTVRNDPRLNPNITQ
ncbi:putative portal protein [Rhizobium phage RHph_X2_28B]|uniref:portal protein n=1 Tax=Rhizobium phage RHph_X2_28B TaxID=2836086 RepID=UPI002329089A|nr:portal protein [Rhizobium phage RHph_X2_28B]QWY83529.1 putative portal protein [Rhizobium phage RHph_X2_28B]QWY83765.1 putative portal protein [Rhizobium phage RHph_X3_15]